VEAGPSSPSPTVLPRARHTSHAGLASLVDLRTDCIASWQTRDGRSRRRRGGSVQPRPRRLRERSRGARRERAADLGEGTPPQAIPPEACSSCPRAQIRLAPP
jgi:hypothetical protein